MPAKSKDYHREYYRKHREQRLADNQKRRDKIRSWYEQYKSSLACHRCGASHPAIIDFHHTDDNKEGGISQIALIKNWSIDRILGEIAKCQPLCRNCHAITHWELRKQ
jgi:hypothetical protein